MYWSSTREPIVQPPGQGRGEEKVRKLLNAFIILPIEDDVYDILGELSAELRRRGDSIGDFDELIASIALANGVSIVTRDYHFQRVPGLQVVMLSTRSIGYLA